MNTFLWALQVILAVKLLTVTFNHGLRPDPVKMKRGRDWLGAGRRAHCWEWSLCSPCWLRWRSSCLPRRAFCRGPRRSQR